MFLGRRKGDMYVPGCEHKGPTGAAMILNRGRALQRRYVSPFSAALCQHRGDTKTAAAPAAQHASRGRSYRHASSREYHVPTAWPGEGLEAAGLAPGTGVRSAL